VQLPDPSLFSEPSGLHVTGLSCIDIGRLGCNESFETTVDIVALLPGLQSLNHCIVSDRLTGAVYTIDDAVCMVYVENNGSQ
jgi:hypothetical protein